LRSPEPFGFPQGPFAVAQGRLREGNPRMGVLQDPTAATFGTLVRLWLDSV